MIIDHDAIKAAFDKWRGPTEEGDRVGHVVFGAGYLAGQAALTARVAELEKDAKRIDYLDECRQRSIAKGFMWDTWAYGVGRDECTIRQQLDAALLAKGE